MSTTAPVAVTGTADTTPAATSGTMAASATGSTPAGTSTSATGAVQLGATAAGDRISNAGAYASTSDKLSLVGRDGVLSDVRVIRIVGLKSFTLASRSEEFLVLIDQDLKQGVGTPGQIDRGKTINLKGNFQRLQQDEISNTSKP